MKELSKRNQRKRDPVKAKIIRNIFEIDDIPNEKPSIANKIKIDYNKTIYFNKASISQMKEDMSKFLSKGLINNPKESEATKTQENLVRTMKVNRNPLVLNGQPKVRSDNDLVKKNNTKDIPCDPHTIDTDRNVCLSKESSLSSTMSNTFSKSTNRLRSSNHLNHTDLRLDLDTLLFVPCMNCGNNIAINNIEQHSSKCTKVSEEIMKNEANAYELYPINYKLKRLKEHVSNISNGLVDVPKECEKEIKYISTVLVQYISDILNIEIISLSSLKEFKKIMKNLEALSLTYKTLMSSLILVDRTKVLVNEKHKIFRETLRIQVNTRRSNNNKTGYLEYENKIKEEMKKIQQIELETELEKTKVKNLRKSAASKDSTKRNEFNLHVLTNENDQDADNDIFIDFKVNDQIGQTNNNKIDDIVSDIGNHSQVLSDNTSISIMISDVGDDNSTNNNMNSNNHANGNADTIPNGEENKRDQSLKDKVNEKRDFFMEVLKIKFEKLHSTHKGLHTSPKLIWEECKRLHIIRRKWTEFILAELNSPLKYVTINKAKSKFGNSIQPTMGIIDEEK